MKPKTVAVIGAVGGAGATTAAAHLSAALSLQQRDTLTFDWCTDNHLRLHFGMALHDRGGWAADLLAGKEWHAAAYRSGNDIDFVPFGQLTDEKELDRLVAWLNGNPTWFAKQLSSLRLPHDTFVVCDCPRMPAVLREQVLRAADFILVVSTSDTLSYAAATRIASGADQGSGPPTAIVLNAFDSSRRLDRDISMLLRTQHKERFSPVVIHRDEALREALACKQTVFDFAPSSQAAYDFSALATWVLARLGHGHQGHLGQELEQA
jgi:cellulose synthase operon protein YhjQ